MKAWRSTALAACLALLRQAPASAAPAPKTFAEIPPLNMNYASPESRARTVTILGASKNDPTIGPHMLMAKQVAAELVRRGYNVLTGCGNAGIMGAAYSGAAQAKREAVKGGAAGENLAIVVTPAWGDENLQDARAIGIAGSEAERVDKFHQASDHFLIFPGGSGTLLETVLLINKNIYRGDTPAKSLTLIGGGFYEGLRRQLQAAYDGGQLKSKPGELIRSADSADEILSRFPR